MFSSLASRAVSSIHTKANKRCMTISINALKKAKPTTKRQPFASSFTSLRPHPSTITSANNIPSHKMNHLNQNILQNSKQTFSTPKQFSQQNFFQKKHSFSSQIRPFSNSPTLSELSRQDNTVTQSSMIATAIIGALFGLGSVYLTSYISPSEQKRVITFDDIEKIITEPSMESFDPDLGHNGRRHKLQFKEYSYQDYGLVFSLPETEMPLKEKINALRTLLSRHIKQTYPLYNLLEEKLDYTNASILERLYIQYVLQAKLLHRQLQREIDQNDIRKRVERDSITQVTNVEQLSQLRSILIMQSDKLKHNYPTPEQCDYLTPDELREAYNSLVVLCKETALQLGYYKFLVLYSGLENVISDDDGGSEGSGAELFQRLDTTVTNTHNSQANAYTDAIDGLPHLNLRQRIGLFRTKTMEQLGENLSNLEFFIDAIPAINENIKAQITADIYRLERESMISRSGDDDDDDNNNNNNNNAENGEKNQNDEIDVEKLEKIISDAYENSKILYDGPLSQIHRDFYQHWLQLAMCDEEQIGMIDENNLGSVYRELRDRYLQSKNQSQIPYFFLKQYEIEKPLQYNELYNKAYLLLPQHQLEESLSEIFLKYYQRDEQYQNEIEQAGL